MDIKGKMEEIIDKAKNDEAFRKELHSDPVKAVEDLLGVDLPDEQVKEIIAGVKEKMHSDAPKEMLENIEEKVSSLFHKKD